MAEERLQKLIARSGLCSRREADRLIREGRVILNGKVAILGDRADLARAHVKVDGKALKAPEQLRYVLLYKPRQVMTTCDDPKERMTVIDIVRPTVKERVFPVGRLDYHSEGLLILTNDGDLAARVSHPRYGVVREYVVKVRGELTKEEYSRLMRGTLIEGQHVKPLSAKLQGRSADSANTWWKVEVTEGRTHEIRELFFRAGHRVQRLRRMAIGPLRDKDIKPGQFRFLSDDEVKALRRACRQPTVRRRPTATRARRRRTRSAGSQ